MLINSFLIPSETSIESLKLFLNASNPLVIMGFNGNNETALGLNNFFYRETMQQIQANLYKETGFFIHKEYYFETPKVVNIDEIFKSKEKSNKV